MSTDGVVPPAPARPRQRLSFKARLHRVRVKRLLVVLTAAAVVFGLLAVSGVYLYARYRYGQIKKVSIPVLAQQQAQQKQATRASGQASGGGGGQPITILLVGSNSRAALDGTQTKAFGTAAEVGGARSDVTMLLRLDPASGKASLLSIPRDLFIPTAGSRTEQRVDAALNTSPEQLVTTIEDGLGIQIDHYIEVNFDSFQHVVDALGGVNMYFPAPIKDSYTGVNITTPGCQHLGGFAALEVVRSRHLYYQQNGVWKYDGWGDLSRIRRDHEFLRVMTSAVEHKGLGNPLTLNAVVGDIAPQLTIDNTFTFDSLVSLASRYRNIDPNTIPELTLPVINASGYTYKGVNYGDVVLPAQPADQQTIQTWIAAPEPAPATRASALASDTAPSPGPVTVTVHNGTGGTGAASLAAAQLKAANYPATVAGSVPATANPAETVIYYHPGEATTALQLLNLTTGAAAIGADPTVPSGTLDLVTGTGLTITTPANAIPPAAPASQGLTGVHGIPGTNAIAPNNDPLFFDPTACPAT